MSLCRPQLYVSASASIRLTAVRDVLAATPGRAALIVAPTREAADGVARDVTRARGASFGMARTSFSAFLHTLAEPVLAARALVPASVLGLEALTSRIVFEARHDEALSYFAPTAWRPGFVRALTATLTELRQAAVRPGNLAPCPRVGGDLAELLDRYERALSAAGLADRAALSDAAIGRLDDPRPLPLDDTLLVLVDLPLRTACETMLMRAILRRAVRVVATVPEADARALAVWQAVGVAADQPSAAERSCDIPAELRYVQRTLFQSDDLPEPAPGAPSSATVTSECPDTTVPAPDGSVSFFSAPGEGREAVEIVRRVIEHARAGTPFDRMAVVLRSPRSYAGLIEAACTRAGVPVYFARHAGRPDPAGRAFLALLAVALEDGSAARFAEYLSFDQVPRMPAATGDWIDADDPAARRGRDEPTTATMPVDEANGPPTTGDDAAEPRERAVSWVWERLLVEASVIGGIGRWRHRLDGLARELDARRAQAYAEDADARRLERLERDAQALAQLRAFVLPIVETFAAWPECETWAGWLARLDVLAPLALARPDRVRATLADLRVLGEMGPVTLREVSDVLAPRLSELPARRQERDAGCLFVGPPDAVRGRTFDVVFVPGLAERMFPQRVRQDPLLPDAVRAMVTAALETESDRSHDERLQLHLAVGAATARLWLSWPRMELASARPRVPSFYALDVERARAGTMDDFEELARRAAVEGDARLSWPAPTRAERAIDVGEYDLAWLGHLLRQPSRAAVTGRARYLLEVSETLGRSLRTRYLRWERTAWSLADGVCLTAAPSGVGDADDQARRAALAAALSTHRLGARPYSPSALQRFAACPYQFYLAGMQGLAPRQDAVALTRLDPLTRGRLVHEVQARCLREAMAAGLVPISVQTLPQLQVRLDAAVDAVSEAYRDAFAPPVDRVWRDEIDAIRTDLHVWLQRLAERDDGWRPLYVELGFGLPADDARDPASVPDVPLIDARFRVRGVVDLIEGRDGTADLRIVDHKTGRRRADDDLVVGRGDVLQPVLYGLAVEAVLHRPVVESRLDYCTSLGGHDVHVVPLASPRYDEHRRRGIEVLEIIDRHIEQGFLPPAPRHGACDYCDFQIVCGPHEPRRLARKDATRLQDLQALRLLE